MKQYIDGIKDLDWVEVINEYFLGISLYGTERKLSCLKHHIWSAVYCDNAKHIPITYYKPLHILHWGFYDPDFDDLQNEDNLKWIDGQPYELIIWSKD